MCFSSSRVIFHSLLFHIAQKNVYRTIHTKIWINIFLFFCSIRFIKIKCRSWWNIKQIIIHHIFGYGFSISQSWSLYTNFSFYLLLYVFTFFSYYLTYWWLDHVFSYLLLLLFCNFQSKTCFCVHFFSFNLRIYIRGRPRKMPLKFFF